MRCVLVTGANGFVGRHLCADLLAGGWQVRGAVRRPEALALLPPGTEPFLIPARATESDWMNALKGVQSVVHLVARTHVLQDRSADPLAEYCAVNVESARPLLAAALRGGVRRFVYLSSIKAVGEGAPIAYTEQTTCNPEEPYGISKRMAEEMILETAAKSALEPVIMRAPLVYGPGVRANFLRLLRAVDRGIPLPLAAIRNQRSMVYVRNLTIAIAEGLTHPQAAGEVFHVADREVVSTRELVLRLGRYLGRPARLVAVPDWLLRLGGHLARRGAEIDRLLRSLTVSTRKLETVLGWTPPYSLDRGLSETVAWYRRAVGG